MNKIILTVTLIVLIFGKTFSQKGKVITIENHKRDSTIISDNQTYQVGEFLRYEAKIGIVKGGEASLTTRIEAIGDSYYYHFRAIGKNAGVAGNFYFLENIYDSYVDILTGMPIKSVRNVKENNYRNYNEVLFDRNKNEIISTNKGIVKSMPNVVDVVSAFYYARRFLFNDLKKDQIVQVTVYFEDKLVTLKFKQSKIEKIHSDFGKIECIKLVPVIEPNGPFKKEKDLQVWVTNDVTHIILKIKAAVAIGTAHFELKEFERITDISILNK